jgi:hypothetical protein
MQLADPESAGKSIAPEFLRSVQRVLHVSRPGAHKRMQLEGLTTDKSFGSLTQFAKAKWFCSPLASGSNNDPEDEFHFDFTSYS